MILKEIQNYVGSQPYVSMDDLCLHFRTEETAMETMLMSLMKKGRVVELNTSSDSCCSTHESDRSGSKLLKLSAGCSGGCAGCSCKAKRYFSAA
jgi:hypothetical protein